MARISFIACSKTKSTLRLPAAALYTSALFRKSLLAACDQSEKVYILSAKHGLLSCNDIVEPYDVTLKTMKRPERIAWGRRTGAELDTVLRPRDKAVLFCGSEYIEPLHADFERLKVKIDTPLGTLSLGERLSLLGKLNEEEELRSMGGSFYRLMQQLWIAQSGGRRIDQASGRQDWPARGVYFVLSGHILRRERMPRIVRVGTHAVSRGSKTTLWDRLSTHRGTSVGGGSHRSSIFRLHVGRAWGRYDESEAWPESWAQGQSAPADIRSGEESLERKVSAIIGAMQVIWLDIDDEPGPASERAYIERNAIGLLSRLGLLQTKSKSAWLGDYSSDWRIAASGLWNLNHLFRRPDPDFIERLTSAVERTIRRRTRVRTVDTKDKEKQAQLSFLPGRGGK